VIRADDGSQVLGVEPSRERGRAYEVAEHYGELAALGRVNGGLVGSRKSVGRHRFRACISVEGSDGIEQFTAMPESADTQLLQILRSQFQEDRLVDLVLPERRLVAFEAKAPQPIHEVHDRALTPPPARGIIGYPKQRVQGVVLQ
jgi:hypothetical protein